MEFRELYHRLMKFGLESLGFYYSAYLCHVVENEDPLNQSRLKVMLSSILGPNTEPVWCYSKGKSPLSHDLPEIGSVVYVEFLNGKLTNPVWTYGFPLQDQKAEEFKSPHTYGFKTPKGYIVLIDEDDKLMDIKTPDGQEIKILENTITINNKNATLTIDDTGISVDATKGDVMLHNDDHHISITDAGIDIDSDKAITVGGQFNVLYSLVPDAPSIQDVSEIGVSKKVRVG